VRVSKDELNVKRMHLPTKIIDLSQPVYANCPQYPDTNPRPVQVRLLYSIAVNGVNKEIVEMSTHKGTHIDAPFHFFDDGSTIDNVELQTYVGRAFLVDLRDKQPGESISENDITQKINGLREGDVALLNTGNGQRRGMNSDFLTRYPYLTGEAAQLLVDRGVRGVGVDAVSLGGYNDPQAAGPPHRIMLGNGKFICEDLYFPNETMDGKERLFVALPIKLQDCGGAWARASLWEFD